MKVKDCPSCQGCPMLKVDTTYVKDGIKIHHLGAEQELVPPKLGSSTRLIVSDAPRETDAQLHEPLVSSSGRIFDSLCRKAGIARDGLNIINTINCRPPNDSFPTDGDSRSYISIADAESAVRHCYKEHVEPLLRSRQWTRIDALGSPALKVLTGKREGVFKWRGSPLPLINGTETLVIPTLEPLYVMKDQSYMPFVVSDLTKGTTPPPEYYNTTPSIDECELFRPERVCFDIETNRFTNQITMVGFAADPFHVLVLPFRGPYIAQIKRILAGAKEVIGQNLLQFDIPFLEKNDVKFKEGVQVWDIMLMFHLLHPDAPGKDLETISSIYTQKPAWKQDQKEDTPTYCARDVDVTLQAFLQLLPLLRMQKLLDLYKYTQVPLAKICHMMTETGIRCDAGRVKFVREKLDAEVNGLEAILPEQLRPYDKAIRVRKPAPPGTIGKSGKPVKYIHIPGTERITPWASPHHVEKFLYETLQLPVQRHPKTKKITTDKGALDRLYRRTKLPEVKAIQRLRQVDELRTTFLKEGTVGVGRVHSNFLVHGTNSGRLSSSGPNLQNLNGTAKYLYVPSHEGWCFVEGDFSSLENRLTAWYANDRERLAKLSIPGYNEHKESTSVIFGIPVAEINKEMPEYRLGKAANHAANYGLGARKFAMTYDITEKEARDILIAWKLSHPLTVQWQEMTAREAEQNGYLTTVFGRKRWFWTTSLYTESLSFKPQSTGADVSYRAMVSLMYDRIGLAPELALKVSEILCPLPKPARLIAQVHDSLLVECPQNKVHEVVKAMNTAMSQPWKELGGYAIPAEFKVGQPNDSWAEITPIKLEEYL